MKKGGNGKMKGLAMMKNASKEEKRWLIAGGVFTFVSLILFYSFIYNDILETMRVGINFWYDLFEGNIRYFYAGRWEMTPFAYTKVVQPVYDFPIYIVFALWNFPLWLAEKFFRVDVFNSALCLMWGKTLLLAATALITFELYKLCRTIKLDHRKSMFACVLFLTSNFFLTSVIIMSAYDIVALYFAIMGINYYCKNNMKGFLICFMLAIPLKFFALLIFVPLLLLKEKRIIPILGYVIMSVLPILVFRIILPCRAVYGEPETASFSLLHMFQSTNLSNLAVLYTVTNELQMSLSRIYYSILGWGILFLICYFVRLDRDEDYYKWSIYICFLTYAILFVTCMSHPYWLLIMCPFVAVMIVQNDSHLYVNLILETVFTWGMILAQMMKFPWCFGNATVSGMFWPAILGKQEKFIPYTPDTILGFFLGDTDGARGYLIGAGCTVFMGGIILFSIFNYPNRKKGMTLLEDKPIRIKGIMAARVLSGFAIALLPLVLYVIGVTRN